MEMISASQSTEMSATGANLYPDACPLLIVGQERDAFSLKD